MQHVTTVTMEVFGPPLAFYNVHAGTRTGFSDVANTGSRHLAAAKSLYSRYRNRPNVRRVELWERLIYPIAPNGSRCETIEVLLYRYKD